MSLAAIVGLGVHTCQTARVVTQPGVLTVPSLLGMTPLYMLVFCLTLRRVPKETWEAAQLDGARAFRCWWSLGIPAARAAFAAIGVLVFVYYWREFKEPLLYIQSIEKYTLSVGLAYLEQLDLPTGPCSWPVRW